MDHYPAIELLESTHDFPCAYTFKVIGRAEEHFVGRVLTTVRGELPPDAEPPFSSRSTSSGRHVSVTLEPTCENAQQVLDIYRALQQVEGIVLLL